MVDQPYTNVSEMPHMHNTPLEPKCCADSCIRLQRLKVGDTVVFEVLSMQRIRVHIVRAADFESGSRCIHPQYTEMVL